MNRFVTALLFSLFLSAPSFAQAPTPVAVAKPAAPVVTKPAVTATVPATATPVKAQRVDLTDVKKAYFDKDANSRVSIVQNRLYSNAGKFEVSLLGSFVNTNQFLSVKSYGLGVAYNLNEYFAVNTLFWQDSVSDSDALGKFKQSTGVSVSLNRPKQFYGGEVRFTPIYGKLSLMSSSIIHFNTHISLGGGMRKTETGSYFTMMAGIGQQAFITRNLILGLDYRLLSFKEDIKEQVVAARLGQFLNSHQELTGVATLSLTLLFGL